LRVSRRVFDRALTESEKMCRVAGADCNRTVAEMVAAGEKLPSPYPPGIKCLSRCVFWKAVTCDLATRIVSLELAVASESGGIVLGAQQPRTSNEHHYGCHNNHIGYHLIRYSSVRGRYPALTRWLCLDFTPPFGYLSGRQLQMLGIMR